MKKIRSVLAAAAAFSLAACASTPSASAAAKVVTGTADGFGGTITAEVTVDDSGKITDLVLTGEDETPDIGGKALPELQKAIVAAGTVEGVDGVSGATYTSKGVFDAVRNALGTSTPAPTVSAQAVSANGLKQGLAIVSTPRLGPGSDDKDVPVYSFNEVIAYVVSDAEDRIVDLEVDILELITPNHDGKDDNYLGMWPGQTYNLDADGDGSVEGTLEETEDSWTGRLSGFRTKRQLGSSYKMNSGTWSEEMDIYENWMKGKTGQELQDLFDSEFSDLNGRPLNGKSDKEDDVAKAGQLSDAQKADIDSLSGATMSLRDAHGDILGAVIAALEHAQPLRSDADIASLGLGVNLVPRLGPGSDDKDVPVYSFNVTAAGVLYDADGRIVDATVDILEIITPNHDGKDDNYLAGWPGQTYNNDSDGDGTVDGELTETEDDWVARIGQFRSKRTLGDAYKMNSGTWSQEMDAYEDWFVGQTADELKGNFAALFSDVNGRPLNGKSDKEQDVAKAGQLSDEQKAQIDALSVATMSLQDGHGDIVGAVESSYANAKASLISAN